VAVSAKTQMTTTQIAAVAEFRVYFLWGSAATANAAQKTAAAPSMEHQLARTSTTTRIFAEIALHFAAVREARLHRHAAMASAKTYGPILTIADIAAVFVRKEKHVVMTKQPGDAKT
jgi:hypothetical protein